MNNYNEIDGNLIQFALNGTFDVITHGCNCFCQMGAGIAPQMAKAFGCNQFRQEIEIPGDINKLGNIDCGTSYLKEGFKPLVYTSKIIKKCLIADGYKELTVINSYTQYHYGKNHNDGVEKPINYNALSLCLQKINHLFKGKHIGLPKIGAGLAGGDWVKIKQIIQRELIDCNVTVVIFNK